VKQGIIDIVSYIFNFAMGITGLIGIAFIVSVFKKEGRQELKEHSFYFLGGVGVVVIAIILLHSFKIPLFFDLHGDYLECTQCKKTIEQINCSNCGKTYKAFPPDELPWEYAERDSN